MTQAVQSSLGVPTCQEQQLLEKKLAAIRLLALDVDGVLTDGSINMGNEGELFKAFNAKDGMGISLALRNGLNVAIITGRKSAIIHNRAQELGITELREGVKDKYGELKTLQEQLGLKQEQVAYMGDDLNDLPAFRASGLRLAPADAAAEVLAAADLVAEYQGGRGAVRYAIEMILKAQGKWESIIASYMLSGQGDRQ